MHVDSITTAPLLDGLHGTRQTLREMAALVRKDASSLALRQTALDIVRQCGGHDFECEIRALFYYCRDSITYRRDPVEVEWIQDAQRTIGIFQSGDCDDKVVCLASLLAVLGHRSRFAVVGKNLDDYTHVYLQVLTKSGWVGLDPTPEQAPAGWEARGMHRATFDIWPTGGGVGGTLGMVALAGLLYYILK